MYKSLIISSLLVFVMLYSCDTKPLTKEFPYGSYVLSEIKVSEKDTLTSLMIAVMGMLGGSDSVFHFTKDSIIHGKDRMSYHYQEGPWKSRINEDSATITIFEDKIYIQTNPRDTSVFRLAHRI
ncbi:MAG: hypothetical protein MUE53_01560 [Chitinophagales bacterium]|jgi:hypothetical protein|nr:hypothetical protein [Chitinophagales bacterium]